MIPCCLRWAEHLPEDSRSQADFRDFEYRKFYAYPAFGYWVQGEYPDTSESKHSTKPPLEYSSANYNHTIEINKAGPHIYRWHVEDTGTGLDLELINVGIPPVNDNSIGGGLGRGFQVAFAWQDFEGFEGIDPALNECITVHNPTQAGSQSGNYSFGSAGDAGSTQAGSIVVAFDQGSDYVDLTVAPMDFIETPPLGLPASPYHTPPAPCASEWHGQPGDGMDQSGAGLWETLTIRQRVDLDFQGREGVHKVTYEVTIPAEITSYAWQATTFGIAQFGALFTLTNASDDAYVYDPINHAAPVHMNSYTFPGLSSPGGRTVTGFKDFWGMAYRQIELVGSSAISPELCAGLADSISETFTDPPSPPTTEPRLASRRGGVFLKTRFPAAAGPNDKFGVGIVGALTPRGLWQDLQHSNFRSTCNPDWSAEYTDVNKNTASAQSLGSLIQIVSALPGGVVTWPVGTTTGVLFFITDTFANFQGHVDWLEANGHI
jgi:hypothetical protein